MTSSRLGEEVSLFNPLLYDDEDDTSSTRTGFCCCMRRGVKTPRGSRGYGTGQHQHQQVFALHENPMLIDPVAFHFHSNLTEKQVKSATVQFVSISGHVSLQDSETSNVRMVSPLIIFCLSRRDEDADIAEAIDHTRDGNDVFVVLVKLTGPDSVYNNAICLSAKNRRRIGGCGMLSYSLDSRKYQETDDNLDMLRRLRHFLLEAVIETD